MNFDPNNKIVQLCAKGMEIEGDGIQASKLFLQAWNEAENHYERFIAAHFVARHQNTIEEKLKWDNLALDNAIQVDMDDIQSVLPSLYLNIGKCYEDLNDFANAKENYLEAQRYSNTLPDDGYGNMIRNGIKNGIERIQI